MSSESIAISSAELRPRLHEEIDRLPDEDVAILHRIALQLELDALTDKLDAEFDRDRSVGKLDRVPELIQEAREAIRNRKTA